MEPELPTLTKNEKKEPEKTQSVSGNSVKESAKGSGKGNSKMSAKEPSSKIKK